MKKIFLLILLLYNCFICFSQVKVSGYYKKNGTYVEPYYRSSPDNSPYNNYSYPGNINPYTGKVTIKKNPKIMLVEILVFFQLI